MVFKICKIKKRIIISLFATFLFGILISCGEKQPQESNETTITLGTEAITTGETYEYPSLDCNGESIVFLNQKNIWDQHFEINVEELNSEVINDTLYNRNRSIEAKFNCKIEEVADPNDYFSGLGPTITKSIMAGSSEYDVIFAPVTLNPSMVTDGYFMDLKKIPELQLDKPWWDQLVAKASTFNDKLYFTTSSLMMPAFEGSWCLYFNENMLEDYSLDKPYQLVKEGKWTIDRLMEYSKAVATPNTDGTFKWDQSGKAIYGISAHPHAMDQFIMAAGALYADTDTNGFPFFNADNARFYAVGEKLAELCVPAKGMYALMSTDDKPSYVKQGGYVAVFCSGRSLFLTGQVKTSQILRSMDDTYGIIPYPKYDESQDNYHTYINRDFLVFTIPITSSNPSRTAAVVDALTYESYNDIIPVYYDVVVTQKGLRNNESAEMLDIIRSSRSVDIAYMFGWNSQLYGAVDDKITKGDGQLTSLIESKKDAINAQIDKTIEYFIES